MAKLSGDVPSDPLDVFRSSVPYFTEEEYLMDDCRRLSKDFVKCEQCEFRFKCYTRKPEGRRILRGYKSEPSDYKLEPSGYNIIPYILDSEDEDNEITG